MLSTIPWDRGKIKELLTDKHTYKILTTNTLLRILYTPHYHTLHVLNKSTTNINLCTDEVWWKKRKEYRMHDQFEGKNSSVQAEIVNPWISFTISLSSGTEFYSLDDWYKKVDWKCILLKCGVIINCFYYVYYVDVDKNKFEIGKRNYACLENWDNHTFVNIILICKYKSFTIWFCLKYFSVCKLKGRIWIAFIVFVLEYPNRIQRIPKCPKPWFDIKIWIKKD